MGKTNPQQTGQEDATATGNMYQQLIAQQEAYNTSQQQQQRGAAASLGLPNSGLDTAGLSAQKASMAPPPTMGGGPGTSTQGPVTGQISPQDASSAQQDPTAQGAAQSASQGQQGASTTPSDTTSAQGAPATDANQPHMNTIQHIVNMLDPKAKADSLAKAAKSQRQPVMGNGGTPLDLGGGAQAQ